MPRTQKPARLWYKKERRTWYIIDAGKQISTGVSDRGEAEEALSAYLVEKGIVRRSGPAEPANITISEVLGIYGEEHGSSVADPARIGYAITALMSFWGSLPVASINGTTCRRYATMRDRSVGTVRRELGVLRAAVSHCQREGHITYAPSVVMPDKPDAKDRWLTRSEAARLISAARSDPRSRHIAWFTLISLYTGTRKSAVLGLQFTPNTMGGWIDLDRGILHRRGHAERSTKKRRGSVPMPTKLLAHMRRLQANGNRWAVEYKGAGCLDVKRSFARSCRAADLDGVTPHTLKHTAVTWALQRGVSIADASSYFSTSIQTIETVYWHHSPDFMRSAVDAMNRRS